MTKRAEIFECKICGNVVEILETGNGELICCEKPMIKLKPKVSEKEGHEKHLPIISQQEDQITIHVGEIEHPMEKEHYINIIQVLQDGIVVAEKSLSHESEPKAVFCTDELNENQDITVRVFCNIHGLWSKNLKLK